MLVEREGLLVPSLAFSLDRPLIQPFSYLLSKVMKLVGFTAEKMVHFIMFLLSYLPLRNTTPFRGILAAFLPA
jgi:hypothetical protein